MSGENRFQVKKDPFWRMLNWVTEIVLELFIGSSTVSKYHTGERAVYGLILEVLIRAHPHPLRAYRVT